MSSEYDGTARYGEVTSSKLGKTVMWHGTTLPTNPTNQVPANGIFLKTDTGILYENTGTEASPTWTSRTSGGQAGDQLYPLPTTILSYVKPTSFTASSGSTVMSNVADTSIDFTSYTTQALADADFVPNDSAKIRVNITNDNLAFEIVGDTTNDSIAYDLSSVSDTIFKVRFSLNYSTLTTGAHWGQHWIGLSSVNQASAYSASQDFIGLFVRPNTTAGALDTDGAALNPTVDNTLGNPSTGTTYYYQIERTSTTAYTVKRYTDSTYTTEAESAVGTCASTTTGLRYFVIRNDSSGAGGAGTAIGVLDNLVVFCLVHTTNSENNPNIYYDMGSAKELHALAINLNKTTTTETELQIRFSTDTTFTSDENVRTLSVSDFTDDTWRYITIPRSLTDKQYFQIYGSSNSVVLSVNGVRYLSKSSADFERGHFHKYISPTSVSANSQDSN